MFKHLFKLLSTFLRKHGYLYVDYGFSCGRHWVSIDGFTIAQTSGDTVNVPDEIVHRIGFHCIDHGKHWSVPDMKIIYQPIIVD